MRTGEGWDGEEEKLKEKFGIQKKKLDSKEKRGLKENVGIAEQLVIIKEVLADILDSE